MLGIKKTNKLNDYKSNLIAISIFQSLKHEQITPCKTPWFQSYIIDMNSLSSALKSLSKSDDRNHPAFLYPKF